MQRLKKLLVVALCCLVLCFDAGSSYVYAADVSPAYSRGKLAWDGVAWALLSALGIATGEATGAVDYLTENVWTPLVAHLKEKWGSMCDVFIDKTNNKSYVSKDMMQDTLDWGIKNNLWDTEAKAPQKEDLKVLYDSNIHHFFDTSKFISFLNGQTLFGSSVFSSENFFNQVTNDDYKNYTVLFISCGADTGYYNWNYFVTALNLPSGGHFRISRVNSWNAKIECFDNTGNIIKPAYTSYEFSNKNKLNDTRLYNENSYSELYLPAYRNNDIFCNIGTGESTPEKDYVIDSGLTVPKAGEKIDDWLAAQDKVNGGSIGLLGNDVTIPSDFTGTGAAIDSLPLTIPSFADLVIDGSISIDDVLSQGLVKANTGAIADTQSAAGAVAGAEDVAATGENAEANAISVDQAQTALKNLMQQGIDYIAFQIPNNFWNKIPFSIPYDIYLLIHGIFVGSSGGSKKAPRREASSGSNMPVGDPSNVGIEIDIPTVPLKYTEEKSEDTPPNFTFTLNIPYNTPDGQTANFNKEFTIETARYNYFAKIIKFSIGLLWLSSVFQWLLAIFSKG